MERWASEKLARQPLRASHLGHCLSHNEKDVEGASFINEGDALHGGVRVVMESANVLANHSVRLIKRRCNCEDVPGLCEAPKPVREVSSKSQQLPGSSAVSPAGGAAISIVCAMSHSSLARWAHLRPLRREDV